MNRKKISSRKNGARVWNRVARNMAIDHPELGSNTPLITHLTF
jgi:hypothetical protein